MSYYTPITSWTVPKHGWYKAFEEMEDDGRQGNEGTCFLVGSRKDEIARITDLAFLRGPGIEKHPDLITISDDLIHELALKIAGSDRCILGQIHSHGINYSTNLSQTDHRYTMRVPGFLSIVAPNYAQEIVTPEECGVHVFETSYGFRRMQPQEARVRLNIVLDEDCGLIYVGGTEQCKSKSL
ncbi:MAG: hypothetical protein K2X77_24985 [Candidatus Obscuribacterales bacterium]|jgi:hypothetical protein|nr:hypothetical protein [Candidatus Obscuribacterales bacterium]